MGKRLQAAVIGAGKMGCYHANIYLKLKNIELVGLVTASGKIRSDNEALKNIPVYSTTEELFANHKVDIVSIASPTTTHKDLAIKAMKVGCHVLLEKPMALNKKQEDAILAAAKKYKKTLMVGFIERFNPVAVKAKAVIEKGKLGKMLMYFAIRGGLAPARPTTDVMMDLGIHDIDLFKFFTGIDESEFENKKIKKVKVKMKDLEDYAVLTAEAKGIQVSFEADWLRSAPQRETRMVFEKGEIVADFGNKTIRFFENGKWKEIKVNKNTNQLELELTKFYRSI